MTKFGREELNPSPHVGRGLILGVSYAPTARGGAKRKPILGVPFYLCTHRLMQNYQISGGNTYGEEACF